MEHAKALASKIRMGAKRCANDREIQVTAGAAAVGGAVFSAGGGAAGLATGTVVGAIAGVAPAFLTCGLSIPVGAVIGACSGTFIGAASGATVGVLGGGALGCAVYRTRKATPCEQTPAVEQPAVPGPLPTAVEPQPAPAEEQVAPADGAERAPRSVEIASAPDAAVAPLRIDESSPPAQEEPITTDPELETAGNSDPPHAAEYNPKAEDPPLLNHLAHVLSSQQKPSLLLSDFGVLVPADWRQRGKHKGALRSFLLRYPDLFKIFGPPGKERVALATHGRDKDIAGAHAMCNDSFAASSATAEDAREGDADQQERDEAALQLRGLPYKADDTDIRCFLGKHAGNLRDEPCPIRLFLGRDARPTGYAKVNFKSRESAKAARDELHMCVMRLSVAVGSTAFSVQQAAEANGNERYIEVFLFTERPNKIRFRSAVIVSGSEQQDDDSSVVCADEKQVLHELRVHMSFHGKEQLLLSMLGVVLSQGSRKYLQTIEQGLKHLLFRYPQEFVIKGTKGRETVTYLPAMNDDVSPAGHDVPENDV